jgi:ferredoxin
LAVTRHVAVNPIACDAHGLCGEVLPEVIPLDDRAYPILDSAPIPFDLDGHARRAAACPTVALLIEEYPGAAPLPPPPAAAPRNGSP